jgi:chromate reductase, NAD(P)H dehydrogenase (quinone)
MKILGISGSLRKGSFNRMALNAVKSLLPAGMQLEVFDLEGIPVYNQDQDATPPARVVEFKKAIRAADAVLICTPEYNYSIPGVLKNAIDWASRPYGDSAWKGKPAAVMGASVGLFGTARAQYHLRQCFVFLDMPAVNQPEVMIGTASSKFDVAGNLTDETSKKLIGQLLGSLAELTKKMKGG